MVMPMLALALLALAQLVVVAVGTGRPRDRHEEAGRDSEHLKAGAQRQVHDVDLGFVLRDRLENSLGNLPWRDLARNRVGLQARFRPHAFAGDERRGNGRHADASGQELLPQRQAKATNAELGGVVDADSRGRHLAGDRRHEDDVPSLAFNHRGRELVREDYARAQVDGDGAVYLVERERSQPAAGRHTGIGYENVDRSRLSSQPLRFACPGQVRHHDSRIAQLIGELGQRSLVPGRQHEPGAGQTEAARYDGTNASRCTGEENRLTAEVFHSSTTGTRWWLSRFPDKTSRSVALLAELELRLHRIADRTLADQAALDLGPRRDLEHRVEQRLLDDRLQGARTCASKQSQLRYGIERALLKDELDVVQREEFLVLLHERVLGLGEDADDVLLVKVVQGHDDRQASDELGDEAVLEQVLRLHVLEGFGNRLALDLRVRRSEPDRAAADSLLDDLLQPVESAAADEQDVGGVDLDEILVRVLAAALRRDVRDRALEDLQQRLLDALTAHIPSDRRVVRLAGDLVDLVDVDDSPLRSADVEVGRLDETQQDVLDVLAHVTGLGEAGGVGDREWNVEDLRQSLREVRLATASRSDQQHVRLRQLDVAHRLGGGDSLVVVVNLDREHLLGAVLPDHVLVERGANRLRVGDETRLLFLGAGRAVVVLEDLLAEVDALVTDENARARDQLAYLVLALAAEAAARVPAAVFSFVHRSFAVSITTRPAPGDYGPTESRWQG